MSSQVTVALVAAVASLGVAAFNAWRLSRLERVAKAEERSFTAKEELDRYREPLLRAALDLASRIDNIRNKDYLDKYLVGGGRRAEIARMSTLYRFARFWCVVENLYGTVALLRFEQDEQTKAVAGMLRKVGHAFATDDHGPHFMMWRDEQRAVAELMKGSSTAVPDTIGFARFLDRYESVFAPWFSAFSDDLDPATARSSQRFKSLQRELARLAKQLDSAGTYRKQCEKLLKGAETDGHKLDH